jgi:thioredoxin 1
MNKQELLDSVKDKKAILDFWAEWCGPCKMVAPVLQELADEHNLELIKINVDEEPELAGEFGITSIPVIMLVENGQVNKQIIGAKPKYALAKDLDL